jgi:hypothetical protein
MLALTRLFGFEEAAVFIAVAACPCSRADNSKVSFAFLHLSVLNSVASA